MLPEGPPSDRLKVTNENLNETSSNPELETATEHSIGPKAAFSDLRNRSRREYSDADGTKRPIRSSEFDLQQLSFFKTARTEAVFLTEDVTSKTVFEPASFDWEREYRRSYELPSSFTEQRISVARTVEREGCDHCGETGHVDCVDCDGSGLVDCSQCGGDGRDEISCGCDDGELRNKIKCDECHQTGTVRVTIRGQRREEDCQMCGGKGHYYEYDPCQSCGSDGIKTVLECTNCTEQRPVGEVACDTCDPTTNQTACPVCDREGERLRIEVEQYHFEPVVETTTNLPDEVAENGLPWPDSEITAEETVDGPMDIESIAQPDGTVVRTKRTSWSYYGGYELVYSNGSTEFTAYVYGDVTYEDEIPYGTGTRGTATDTAQPVRDYFGFFSGVDSRAITYSPSIAAFAFGGYVYWGSGTPLRLSSGIVLILALSLVCLGIVLTLTRGVRS